MKWKAIPLIYLSATAFCLLHERQLPLLCLPQSVCKNNLKVKTLFVGMWVLLACLDKFCFTLKLWPTSDKGGMRTSFDADMGQTPKQNKACRDRLECYIIIGQ